MKQRSLHKKPPAPPSQRNGTGGSRDTAPRVLLCERPSPASASPPGATRETGTAHDGWPESNRLARDARLPFGHGFQIRSMGYSDQRSARSTVTTAVPVPLVATVSRRPSRNFGVCPGFSGQTGVFWCSELLGGFRGRYRPSLTSYACCHQVSTTTPGRDEPAGRRCLFSRLSAASDTHSGLLS